MLLISILSGIINYIIKMSQSDHEDHQRSFPSSIPVRSPSPDLKNRNRILKTISPTLQLRKQMTPILRDSRGYATLPNDQNEDAPYGIPDFDKSYEAIDIKRLREKLEEKDRIILQLSGKSGGSDVRGSRTNEDWKAKLAEKDRIINDLKKVLASLTEKKEISESRSENDKIKTLEIENERLGELVKKLAKKDTQEKKDMQEKLCQEIEMLEARVDELAFHNKQLEDKIMRGKKERETEVVGLRDEIEQLKTRNSELLQYEQKNNSLQIENQRLLKLLTDKKSSLPEITISQENEIFRLQSEIKALKQKTAPEKMTLSKIREQYNESLRLFKDQVEHMVDLQFEKIQEIINNLKSKLLYVESKIPQIDELQRSVMESPVKLAQLSKSYIEETADLNSEIKRQRGERRAVEDKLEQLQRTYDNLLRSREEDLFKSQEKMRQSVVDIEQLKNEAQIDRNKHYQELDIIHASHENELTRLRNKHREEMEEFKNSTKYEINEVVANYDKEIAVLKVGLSTGEAEIYRLQQEGKNKELEYRRNIQIAEEVLKKEEREVTRLAGLLNEKQSAMKSLRQNKQEIEELGEVRKRSQTELQMRYNEIETKYSQLLGNHADTSTKYAQLLNKSNGTVEELQRAKRANLEAEEIIRNLTVENQMIFELKNQVTSLQGQLLGAQQMIQHMRVEYEQLERQYDGAGRQLKDYEQQIKNSDQSLRNSEQELAQTKIQKQQLLSEMTLMKSRILNLSSKTKVTVQSITRLQTETLHPNREFLRLLDEIALRITRLEKQNESLKGITSNKHILLDNIKKDLLRSQMQLKTARFQSQQLKNDIGYLNQKLELKDRELNELKELLESRAVHESTIVEEVEEKEVDLEDVARLRREYERVIGTLSTEIVEIKRSIKEVREGEVEAGEE